MLQGWMLVNRTGHAFPMEENRGALLWKTCLRQIGIFPEGQLNLELLDSDQVYVGEKAYGFLLEVICGLHSPLAGETEVFGQFKDFYASIDWNSHSEMRFFKEVGLQLFIDAKKVRTKYLKGLGSQSYGSLARRWLSSEEDIHVLGAGRLAQDILPWLIKSSCRVTLYVRDPQKVESSDWFKAYRDRVRVFSYQEKRPAAGGVIVCAPLTSQQITYWLKEASISRILDLRGESEQDPILGSGVVQSLQQAFKKIESTKGRVKDQSLKAFNEISGLAVQAFQAQKVRPFGWDDLCA